MPQPQKSALHARLQSPGLPSLLLLLLLLGRHLGCSLGLGRRQQQLVGYSLGLGRRQQQQQQQHHPRPHLGVFSLALVARLRRVEQQQAAVA
jgi:hypothetical protein